MAGLVVDRTVSPARPRRSAPPAQFAVLVAVALGLLFGAMACAAGLAGGVAHGAVEPSAREMDGALAHADHLAMMESSSQTMPAGDHSDGSSNPGSHPGTACVVSVDLHFPEASSASTSDSSEFPLMGSSTGCPADVDPPVPRFS